MSSDCYLKDYYNQLPPEPADFDNAGQTESASPTAECPAPQQSSESPEEQAENSAGCGLIDGTSQGGHPTFEPAPASSFLPEQTHVEPDRECEPVTNGDTEVATEDDDVVCQKELASDASEGVDASDVVEKDVPASVDGVQDVKESDPSGEDIGKTTSEGLFIPICIPEAELEQGKVQKRGDSDPVIDLLYWRDVKKTATVFSSILLILFPLMCYSVLAVLAYATLAMLVVTVGFRLYRLVLQTLNGTQQPHPFQDYLDFDFSLSTENAQKYANIISTNANLCVGAIRDLVFVKNTLSSLKFCVFLWLLTFVGSLFNGLTLLIIDVILLFTVPPIYEKYQAQIDSYYSLAKDKANVVVASIKQKLPGKKEKTQ